MLLLAASARLYSALLVLYPKAFRRRYSEEMRRDFSELLREGLEEGGAKELVRVWVGAFWDLVLTVLKERGTTSARRYRAYLSVDPRIAVRAAARAMVAVVLVAVGVSWASFWQTPTYEASAQVWAGQKGVELSGQAGSGEMRKTLPPKIEQLSQTMAHAIDSRPVAEETIQLLGLRMKPAELSDNLTVQQVEGTNFISLTYEGTSAAEATQIVNTMADVSSERISTTTKAAGSNLTATPYVKAKVPDNPTPVSSNPLRNGLLTLVTGLVLGVGLVVALPSLAASVAGKLGRPNVLQGVGQAGLLGEALDRRGKLTAVEAALETSLSVEEAERMLEALAVRGHLEVTVEHGRLVYALWEQD
jgi:capsular polysaccharide biosynthesis protein